MSSNFPQAAARALVLEDNFLSALELCDRLRALGLLVDGPHASIAQAKQACRERLPELALLDVHVRDGLSVEFAHELCTRDVPVVFITGFGFIPDLPPALADAPKLFKPVDGRTLETVVRACLKLPPQT